MDRLLLRATVRCPRCRSTDLERGVGRHGGKDLLGCPKCGQKFTAEEGIDRRDVERAKQKAVGLVRDEIHRELKKAFKGVKGVTFKSR